MKKMRALCVVFSLAVMLSAPAFAAKKPASGLPAVEIPAVATNFETQRFEIMQALNLDAKQQEKAQKIYEKAKAEIIKLNTELEAKAAQKREIKLNAQNSRQQLEKLVKLNNEADALYFKRDKIQNQALKKFENTLTKAQKQTWQALKQKGTRLYPEPDTLK